MKIFLQYIILATFIFSAESYAFTDCPRPVRNVWNSLASDSIWVTFSDGGGAIYKTGSQMTENQMNRFFSQVLTAQTAGKKLSVRYPENNFSCPPPQGVNRNDVEGAWILN